MAAFGRELRLAHRAAELGVLLRKEPAGVSSGWLWKPYNSAPPHPSGWLRFHLAILLNLLLLQLPFRTILRQSTP